MVSCTDNTDLFYPSFRSLHPSLASISLFFQQVLGTVSFHCTIGLSAVGTYRYTLHTQEDEYFFYRATSGERDISLTNQLADIRCIGLRKHWQCMENKETKKSVVVVDNVVAAVLLCNYSPVHV